MHVSTDILTFHYVNVHMVHLDHTTCENIRIHLFIMKGEVQWYHKHSDSVCSPSRFIILIFKTALLLGGKYTHMRRP